MGSRPSDPRVSATLPWAVASIAVIALVALVAGRSVGARRGAAAQPSAPAAAADDTTQETPVRAPDISNMSPSERADRLYDRVMRLHEEGKDDSVRFFSPMVLQAYQMLGPLDADQHYDLGRIAEVLGMSELARAEADTILKAQPTHLLGLTLAARVAPAAKKSDFYRRLLAAEPAERKRALPEYDRHKDDIDAALAMARGSR